MKVLKLLFFYQCSVCCKSSLEVDDAAETDSSFDNVVLEHPQGILELGLSDPRNTVYVYNTLYNNMKNDDFSKTDSPGINDIDRVQNTNIQQKRFGYKPNSYNDVNNNIDAEQNAIPASTSFNAVRSYGLMFGRLPFRPKVRVEVRAKDPFDQEQLSHATVVPLRPSLDIMSAIFSAALQRFLILPTESNPYNVMIEYNPQLGCDMIISALDIPNMGVHSWKIRVTRRRGKVIYDNVCLSPSRRNIRMRHGTRVTVYYS